MLIRLSGVGFTANQCEYLSFAPDIILLCHHKLLPRMAWRALYLFGLLCIETR
jgi:hypothetical protein